MKNLKNYIIIFIESQKTVFSKRKGECAMMYIIHYVDDKHKKHITFVRSFRDVQFLRDRFGEITVETYKIE